MIIEIAIGVFIALVLLATIDKWLPPVLYMLALLAVFGAILFAAVLVGG